jgi:hypothetical protein
LQPFDFLLDLLPAVAGFKEDIVRVVPGFDSLSLSDTSNALDQSFQ